jgi:hypothetical protein
MPPPTETILGDGKGTGELPVGLSAAVAELRADLVRWRQELGEGGTGTWVAGVAASAQWQLDPIARKLLAAYVEASGAIDYARDTPVRRGKTDAKPGKPRPIGKLSLGQTVQCFEKFDGQLTEWCRASGRLTEGETLARHGRPDDPLKRVLDLRNPMAHPEETGKEAGRQGLARRTLELLDAMEEALAMPLFQIGASL